MKNFLKYLIGYIIGIFIFVLLIPFLLFKLSGAVDPMLNIQIINNFTIRLIIAIPLLAIGAVFFLWSNFALFIIGKGGPTDGFGIAVTPRTKKLVITGPYKLSRNPMVFGAFFFYFSISLYLDSLACFTALIVFLFLVVFYLKQTEEKRLYKDFGNEFIEYKRKVPMIFPFLKLSRK